MVAVWSVFSGGPRALQGCVSFPLLVLLSVYGEGTPESDTAVLLPLLTLPGPARHLLCALQEGRDGHCVPRGCGALRRDPGLLLPGGARPLPDEAFRGHRCGHPALPQRCVLEASSGPVGGPVQLSQFSPRMSCCSNIW